MNYIMNKITEQDKFYHAPQLRFKEKISQKTFPGGVWSILLNIFLYYQWYSYFQIMFTYKKGQVSYAETNADFQEIGKVLLKNMGALPFYAVYHKGR